MKTPAMATPTGSIRRGWSKEEDETLISYIHNHGEGCNWRTIAQASGLKRCGKSCRLRWKSHLKPGLKRGNYTDDEDDLIIKLHALLGNRWTLIAGRLPGRTGEEVKNQWNTRIKKKLMKQGIDPSNHRINQTLPRRDRDDDEEDDFLADSRVPLPDLNLEYIP